MTREKPGPRGEGKQGRTRHRAPTGQNLGADRTRTPDPEPEDGTLGTTWACKASSSPIQGPRTQTAASSCEAPGHSPQRAESLDPETTLSISALREGENEAQGDLGFN